MSNDLIQKNAELGRFLFCERYTLQPVKNALYIAEGQDLKRGAVVDVNGVLVGTNSLMPYAVLENDCDTRAKGAFASVFVKGEFNFDKLFFADGLSKEDLDNIVYNGNGTGLVFKPYTYDSDFSSAMVPAGTSEENPLMNAADTELMIAEMMPIAANTLRFNFSKKDYDPTIAGVGSTGTWNKVTKYCNVWDWKRSGNNFSTSFNEAFKDSQNIVSVIAAGNTSSVTDTASMFMNCSSLDSVVLFDTSSVVGASSMFNGCSSLKRIPLFNTSSMMNTYSMFNGCRKVEAGSLALYQKASTQTTPPSTHVNMFLNCGIDTATGETELAQIPKSWGGLAEG